MSLITQTEIIESVRVDSNFSVNNITDDTIQKAELYLAATFLGNRLYDALEADKSGEGTFTSVKYQTLYNKYLRRLISEYVLFMSIDEIILRVANNGLNNEEQLQALKYSKDSLREESERSKAMIKAFLINNKTTYPLFAENLEAETSEEKPKKISLFGFVRESETESETQFIDQQNFLI